MSRRKTILSTVFQRLTVSSYESDGSSLNIPTKGGDTKPNPTKGADPSRSLYPHIYTASDFLEPNSAHSPYFMRPTPPKHISQSTESSFSTISDRTWKSKRFLNRTYKKICHLWVIFSYCIDYTYFVDHFNDQKVVHLDYFSIISPCRYSLCFIFKTRVFPYTYKLNISKTFDIQKLHS